MSSKFIRSTVPHNYLQGEMPKVRRDLSQTMLAKNMRDTSDTDDYRLIATVHREESGSQKLQPCPLRGSTGSSPRLVLQTSLLNKGTEVKFPFSLFQSLQKSLCGSPELSKDFMNSFQIKLFQLLLHQGGIVL